MRFILADQKRASNASAQQSKVNQAQNDDSNSLRWGRRGFLRAASGVAVTGLLAGCTSVGSAGDGGASDTSRGDSGANKSGGGSVDAWLADTDNYDSIADMTGKKSVTVEVGAEGNNGAYAFAPAAIEISPGTTVVWKWVDGYHNVAEKDGGFTSGEPEVNATFEYTFETAGTILYLCEPHESMEMKGAVIVADQGDESGTNSGNGENQ